MRLTLFFTTLFALFTFVLAWTKEDYEIFDLVSAIEAAEGPGTTFYSWLEVSPKATNADISKAYRKKSLALHPDKNPNVKGIQQRYARLGVVAAILRDSVGRERYDFFFKNGVPKWRGTGYYYSRYRPGLGSVAVFLVILTSGAQLFVQRFNYKKDVNRIERFVRKARMMAWGVDMVPKPGARKVRLSLSDNPHDDRSVEMLVDGDHVYLIGDGEQVPLDTNVATKPTIGGTWAVSLVRKLFRTVIPDSSKGIAAASEAETAGETEADETDDAAESADGTSTLSSGRKTKPAEMSGGRRRKAPTKSMKKAE